MTGLLLASTCLAILVGFFYFAGPIFGAPPRAVWPFTAGGLLLALLAPDEFVVLLVVVLVVAALVTLTDWICR